MDVLVSCNGRSTSTENLPQRPPRLFAIQAVIQASGDQSNAAGFAEFHAVLIRHDLIVRGVDDDAVLLNRRGLAPAFPGWGKQDQRPNDAHGSMTEMDFFMIVLPLLHSTPERSKPVFTGNLWQSARRRDRLAGRWSAA